MIEHPLHPHGYSLGHTMARAAIWRSVGRVVDHLLFGLVAAGVSVLVVVAVASWALRFHRRRARTRW